MKRITIGSIIIIILLLLATASAAAEELDMAYIQGGALVTNFTAPNARGVIARYTGVDLNEPVRKMRCKARFYGGGAVALVATPSPELSLHGITQRSIHAVFSSDGYHFGFYEDGILTDVLADGYTLDLTGETEYSFGFSISGNTITLTLPTGEKVKKWDDRVKTCNGQYIIFEHYLTADTVAHGFAPEITYVYGKGNNRRALEDDFQREDGLPGEAPTGHAYVQFRNE